MTRRSASTRIVGGALAVVLATTLTGCFANPLDAIVENATEETAKNATEDMIETLTGGEANIEFGELPDDFPADVTLVSENVLQSVAVADGMMVVVSDPRSMDEVVAQVKQDFAGWEEVVSSDMDEMVSYMFKKDESLGVGVGIMAGSDGEDTSVSYTIIRPGK